ncbi:protein FAR1-RELATED SEQUENCE 4-like [Chenopodium quinoa]|uniref:protein FAR1-RELATED SEQUENCE 4-like n=1 Tax=Chenopodium quinoa TaxID=63459 RepID=UPI000B787633|nr:protein FAR1-RELATED SEQUENCE 4-like [Chenopodium quinoa]
MEYLETTEDIERYNSGGELGPSIPEAVDDDCGEMDCAAALELLLNQVIVGEESFKTPTKGKGNVSISIQIEEAGEVEMDVALPPPSIGMVFESMIEVDKYFREYGQQNGFGVVRASGANNGKGAKRNCRWTCESYGRPGRKRKKSEVGLVTDAQISEDEELCPKRKSKKCECPVFVYAHVNGVGQWEITKAKMEHDGHSPTPSKAKSISKFRKKFLVENPHIVKQLFQERRAGVPVSTIYRSMARHRNWLEGMQFEQKDLHDEVSKERKRVFEEGDAKAMFSYFKRMVDDNLNFFHTYRVDEEGRLKDVLWVDARSRVAYEEFGDVVVFDSTYLTNEYKLPFCNFVGVNHHGQTILFGCALVTRENAETFEWVFSNWLRCMGDKEPIGILTDQDPAMRKALKVVMKGTTHRWCIWHIINKFGKKLGKHVKYQELKEALKHAIYDSLDCEEYEERLYEERAMWVPAFVKHLFWAGMRTTQRVESIHSFFDGYLSRHTLLHEFVERYVEALEVRATAEKKADDNNARYVRKAYSDFPAQLIFQKIYTDAKFKEVQRECSRSLYVSPIEKGLVSESIIEHVVEDRVWYKPKNCTKEKPSKRKRRYKITFDCVSKEASCDCKHFECHDIICRHIIKVYELNDHYEIPDKFILRRWRKDVIRKHTRVKVAYHDPNKTDEVCRYDKMMVKFGSLSTKACVYKTTTDLVIQSLQLLEIQVDEKLSMINGSNAQGEGRGEKGTPVTPSTQRQGSCSEVPKDPPMPKRPAHRTTAVRFPSCVEKSTKGGKTNNKRNTKKSSQVENDSQCTPSYATPSYSQMGSPHGFVFPYSPHSIGGIQMVDADGSIGYFTGVSGANTPHTPSANMSGTDRQSVYHHHYRPVIPCTEAVATPSTPNSATPPASENYRPIAPKPVFLPFGPYHHQQYVQAYHHQYLHPNQHPHELRIRPNGTNQHANGTTNTK